MMFESLPPPVISKLVHVLERNTYQKGDKIATAGEHGTAMYVLVEGQASLSVDVELKFAPRRQRPPKFRPAEKGVPIALLRKPGRLSR